MQPRCPTCKKPVSASNAEKTFPFCGTRCKLADLHGWLSGSYVVEGSAAADDGLLDEAELLALMRERSQENS